MKNVPDSSSRFEFYFSVTMLVANLYLFFLFPDNHITKLFAMVRWLKGALKLDEAYQKLRQGGRQKRQYATQFH
jgi:hypothetical protein